MAGREADIWQEGREIDARKGGQEET